MITAIVERVNKKHPGKAKIRADAVICYALGLLDETHFESLRVQSLSNEDRFAMRFETLAKGRSSLSWEDYLGMVMDGKVTFCPESDQR
jgi:hypothetical protein